MQGANKLAGYLIELSNRFRIHWQLPAEDDTGLPHT